MYIISPVSLTKHGLSQIRALLFELICWNRLFVCSVTFHFSFSTECRSRKLSHQGGDTDTAQDRDKLGHKEFLIIWSTLIKKITFILIFVNSAAACWQVYWSINRPECFWLYSAQLGFYSSNKTSTSTSMVASMIYKMFQVYNRYNVTDRSRPNCLHNTTTHAMYIR